MLFTNYVLVDRDNSIMSKNQHCWIVEIFFNLPNLIYGKNTILAITYTNLQYKNVQTPPELDSDQDPPKTPHAPCRRPSER